MNFRRSLPKKTAVERTRKPEKLSRRQAAKLIYINNSGRCTMLPELEKESVHHDIQINRNVFFRFIIFDFVGIKRIFVLGMKRTIEISLRVKGVCRISIREILIVGMFGQIEFGGEERTNAADLQVPSSIMRKFIYKSGRTQSAQGRETCP